MIEKSQLELKLILVGCEGFEPPNLLGVNQMSLTN